jgi:hypothetical protein
MPPLRDFTRRGFIAGSSAAAGAAIGVPVWAQSTSQAAGRSAEFVVPPPKVITGATRPLLAGNTARPLRYRPVDGDFVIRNGGDFFNRPLYGPNINFYVDAGDLPEFSLFLPGHGGVAPNCLFVSQWRQDQPEVEIPLAGRAEGVYLLITGITFPQASRMEHGSITVVYTDGVKAQLPLKSLESAQTAPYAPPQSPRAKMNFNLNWKFIREDVPGAEAPGFDDSAWTTVSLPHSFNDVDSFRKIISHSGGDLGTYKGLAWYRKHFKLPAKLAGNKIFLEFEGMRQAGDIFLNGKQLGFTRTG